MSDPRAKAERSKAKDLRQGIVEQRPVSSKSSKKKPWIVRAEFTTGWNWARERETTLGRYAKRSDAEKAVESFSRKTYYTNVRIEEE